MEIKVIRETFSEISTIGRMTIDGLFECYTLEDKVRTGPKVPGKTAIPYGRYEVVIDDSVRFKKPMPHILDVPDFTGVRIHPLNIAQETEGCIGVGNTKGVDFIGESKAAFSVFFLKLDKALKTGKVFVDVVKG